MTLAIVVGGSLDARAAPDPFEGCKRTPGTGGFTFECGGAIGVALDTPGGNVRQQVESQIGLWRESLHQVPKATLTTIDQIYRAGDKSWPEVRLEYRRTGSQALVFEGHILGFKPDENTARFVLCGGVPDAKTSSTCAALLPLLTEKGPGPFVPAAQVLQFLAIALDPTSHSLACAVSSLTCCVLLSRGPQRRCAFQLRNAQSTKLVESGCACIIVS